MYDIKYHRKTTSMLLATWRMLKQIPVRSRRCLPRLMVVMYARRSGAVRQGCDPITTSCGDGVFLEERSPEKYGVTMCCRSKSEFYCNTTILSSISPQSCSPRSSPGRFAISVSRDEIIVLFFGKTLPGFYFWCILVECFTLYNSLVIWDRPLERRLASHDSHEAGS